MADAKRILLVEDDVFIAELYIRALKAANFDLTVVRNGNDALHKAKDEPFDIMLLDIMVPEMTGVEVLKKLREDGTKNPDMKIIITTNLEEKEEDRSQIEELADGYIIKADITPTALVATIQNFDKDGPDRVE